MKIIKIIILLFYISSNIYAQNNRTLKNIEDYKLQLTKNKLPVIYIKNNIDKNIYLRLTFDISEHLQKEQKGINIITWELIENQFKNNIQAKNAGIKFIFKKNNITVTHSANNIDTLLYYTYKIYSEIKFNDSEFSDVKRSVKTALFPPTISPRLYIENKAREFMYTKYHPLHENYDKDGINSITLSDCENYFNDYYVNSSKYIFLMGKLKSEVAYEKVRTYFSELKNSTKMNIKVPENKLPKYSKIYYHKTKSKITGGKTYMHITYPSSVTPNSNDIHSAIILNFILNTYKTGLIHKKIITEKNIAELAVSELKYDSKYSEFYCSIVCNPVDIATIVNDVIEIQRYVIENEIYDAELKVAKKNIKNEFNSNLKNPLKVLDMLFTIQKFKLKKSYYSNFLSSLQSVKVKDIKKVAQKYLRLNNYTIAILGKENKIRNQFLKLSDKAETTILVNNEEIEKIPFGFTPISVINDYLEAINFKHPAKRQTIKLKGIYNSNNQKNVVTHKIHRKNNNYKSTILLHPTSRDKMLLQEEIVYKNNALFITKENSKTLSDNDKAKIITKSFQLPEHEYSVNKKIKLSLEGIFTLDTVDTYKIKVEYPYGETRFDYYDIESKLKIKSENLKQTKKGYEVIKTINISDYREIPETKGILFPYKKKLIAEDYYANFKVVYISLKDGIKNRVFKFNKDLIRY